MKAQSFFFRHKKGIIFAACFLVVLASTPFAISTYVVQNTKDAVVDIETAAQLEADCILVLGAGVREDGSPSPMLEDRLLTAIELYENGAAPKLLMSGDHGTLSYDEVNTMKDYAVAKGVPSSDIFMDHAGFSTYESIYRVRDIFAAERVILVTQEFHLSRALYIADALGLEAWGVVADRRNYGGETYYEMREVLARTKDVGQCIFQPLPTFLGEVLPVSGDGDQTNDKQ